MNALHLCTLQIAVSQCDFGHINDHRYIDEGVVGVSRPLRAATIQLKSEEELQEMTAVTLVEIHGVQYLYIALISVSNENKITKVWT